jgi:glycine betaine/proline transport system substrate-binding protein
VTSTRSSRDVRLSLGDARIFSIEPVWGLVLVVGLVLLTAVHDAQASASSNHRDDPACQTVRIAEAGWTDATAISAMLSSVLRDLSYTPQVTVVSVSVTFASLKRKDIDVFLSNWMPAQEANRKPYLVDHSIEVIGANLSDAKYTLAVPGYTYDAGLKDFADIHRFGAALSNSIYGIEPGNDGNRFVLKMLQQNQFGLGGFKLIESSEQAMLAEVERAHRTHAPIVFLAWSPHPMNLRFDLRYLSGGDTIFGPNYGGATVYTVTRAGYAKLCPNIGRLLRNLKLTAIGESQVMAAVLEHQQPEAAAAAWLQRNPRVKEAWL